MDEGESPYGKGCWWGVTAGVGFSPVTLPEVPVTPFSAASLVISPVD